MHWLSFSVPVWMSWDDASEWFGWKRDYLAWDCGLALSAPHPITSSVTHHEDCTSSVEKETPASCTFQAFNVKVFLGLLLLCSPIKAEVNSCYMWGLLWSLSNWLQQSSASLTECGNLLINLIISCFLCMCHSLFTSFILLQVSETKCWNEQQIFRVRTLPSWGGPACVEACSSRILCSPLQTNPFFTRGAPHRDWPGRGQGWAWPPSLSKNKHHGYIFF